MFAIFSVRQLLVLGRKRLLHCFLADVPADPLPEIQSLRQLLCPLRLLSDSKIVVSRADVTLPLHWGESVRLPCDKG